MATLTYVYAESTAVLGPLAIEAEPGTYDLCARHAASTSAPRGWEIIRLPDDDPVAEHRAAEADDELMALANAVRQIGLRHDDPEAVEPPAAPEAPSAPSAPHLRIIED